MADGKKVRKVYYTAMCKDHGSKGSVDVVPWVKTRIPLNKRQANMGCPVCRSINKKKV